MSLSVTFPAEIEAALRRRAALLGKDVDALARDIVSEEVAEAVIYEPSDVSHVEFMHRLDEMILRHGIRSGKFDDSRDSIYSGRGE